MNVYFCCPQYNKYLIIYDILPGVSKFSNSENGVIGNISALGAGSVGSSPAFLSSIYFLSCSTFFITR